MPDPDVISASDTQQVTTDQLKECGEQLAVTKAELDGLLYAISHDLRAPLRAITGFSLALREDCLDGLSPSGQHHLARIQESAQKLQSMLDGLLTLSRQSQTELIVLELNISALAQEAADQVARQYPHHHPTLNITADLTARGDPRALRQMLQHLFDNAFKCTIDSPQACIEFGATKEKATRVFHVRDNGVGFDMNQAHKLFVPFQRLHMRADLCGAGLGLACAQRIIARHGGRIWAEAEQNNGATFYFTLQSSD